MQSTDSTYTVPPFPAFPSPSRYIPLGSVNEAFDRVCRSIDARDTVSLVVGPPGTGKSLICGLLVQHYRDSHEVVVLGETPIEDAGALMRHLLHQLGADFDKLPEGDLQLALINRVCGADAPEGGLLIIVDEAQSLPKSVIEAIRMVTNIMRDGQPRVSAVLCGGVKLDEILVEPCMEAFTQRVATRCYLHAMNAEETRQYVTKTIQNCGAHPEQTISAEAIAAVHHACSGIPRLVNQIMTQAIDCAEESDQARITEQIIDLAWAQLQQLPSPIVEEPRILRDSAPVEFGDLDDTVNFGEWTPDEPAVSEETPGPTTSGNRVVSISAPEDDCDCGSPQCQSDIEIHQPEAEWIEEPRVVEPVETTTAVSAARPCQPTTSEPAALFGDFEEEEEIAVGNAFASPQQAKPVMPPSDLESMLHQEIIGINSGDYRDELVDGGQAAIMDATDDFDLDEEPEEQVEDFITTAEEELDHHGDEVGPVIWMPDASGSDIQSGDDSEILVIEDEIELRRVDPQERVDSQDKTISVDFQAMLHRMRSGT